MPTPSPDESGRAALGGFWRPHVWMPLVLFVAGLIVTRHAWGGIAPGGDDVPYHLSRAVFAWRQIFPSGHLDGWFPQFGAGSQAFLVYGPGLAIAYGLVKAVTFGQIGDGAAMTAVMTLSYAAVAPAVYFLGRSFRMSHTASGVAGAVALCVSVPFGVGVAGTFDLGLAGFGLAAPLFCCALGLIVRLVDRPDEPSTRLCAIAVGALVVTHPLSVVLLGLTLAVVLPSCWVQAERRAVAFRRLMIAGVGSVTLIGWWLVPLAFRHDPRGPLSDWATPPFWSRMADIATGKIAFAPVVAGLVVVAFGVLFVQLPRRSAAVWDQAAGRGLLVAPLVLLPIAFGMRALWGINDTVAMIPNRILGYVGLLASLVAGQFVASVVESRPVPTVVARWTVPLVAALVAGVPALVQRYDTITHVDALPPSITEAATALHSLMTPSTRFVFDDADVDFRNHFGIVHPEMWISLAAGRNTVADLGGNSVSGFDNYLQDHLFDQPVDTVTAALARAGVTALVVGRADVSNAAQWPGWVQSWTDDTTWIFRRVASDHGVQPGALLVAGRTMRADLLDATAERVRWSAATTRPTDVTIGVAAFGKWHLRFDGTEVPLRTADGLITARLPTGAGVLELTYERDLGDLVGTGLSVGTVLVMVFGRRVRRVVGGRPRRQTPAGAAS